MRFDLKQPCKNCPFSNGPERIVFSCRDRATEIAEQAYRQGFPCHLSATLDEDDDSGDAGYEFGPNTQHCAGAIGTFLNSDYTEWPGIDNDEELAERLAIQMGPAGLAMCFESEEAFIEANAEELGRYTKTGGGRG